MGLKIRYAEHIIQGDASYAFFSQQQQALMNRQKAVVYASLREKTGRQKYIDQELSVEYVNHSAVFFSHNKSVNGIFCHSLSAKQTTCARIMEHGDRSRLESRGTSDDDKGSEIGGTLLHATLQKARKAPISYHGPTTPC